MVDTFEVMECEEEVAHAIQMDTFDALNRGGRITLGNQIVPDSIPWLHSP